MRIELDDVSRPQVLALLEEHLRNMHEVTPPGQVFAFDAHKLRSPGLAFWTAWEEGVLLGCAALQEISPVQGEVKSMRTPASLRRNGAGRALLDHILQVARKRGYRELYLETGSHPAFTQARTLYRSAGFRECGPFGAYRDNGFSVFMSLCLRADPEATEILSYNESQEPGDKAICDLLAEVISRKLPEAENKIWHAHPVWFLDGNPVVGYSRQKPGIRLMFWSGAGFEEPGLNVVGEKFKDASAFYGEVSEVSMADLHRWLKKAREVQWDYKNIVRRKGRLERLK